MAARTGVNADVLRNVGVGEPIRFLKTLDPAKYLGVKIGGWMMAHFAVDPDSSAFCATECAKIALEKMAGMTEAEIEMAFKMGASGDLGQLDETYGGRFSTKHFSRMMRAFSIKRAEILGEFEKVDAADAERAAEQERAEASRKARKQVCDEFEALCLKNEKIDRFQNVPIHWPAILKDVGHLNKSSQDDRDSVWTVVRGLFRGHFVAKKPFLVGYSDGQLKLVYEALEKNPDEIPLVLEKHFWDYLGRWMVFKKLAPFTGIGQKGGTTTTENAAVDAMRGRLAFPESKLAPSDPAIARWHQEMAETVVEAEIEEDENETEP